MRREGEGGHDGGFAGLEGLGNRGRGRGRWRGHGSGAGGTGFSFVLGMLKVALDKGGEKKKDRRLKRDDRERKEKRNVWSVFYGIKMDWSG